jgi:hypothetical protein
MIALVAAPPGDGAVTIVYILIGIVTIGGGGGAIGIWRTSRADRRRAEKVAREQGVRDERLDRVISAVLGDEQHDGAGGVLRRLDAQDRQSETQGRILADIQREQKPNGGNTQRLGDIAKRTERKVDEIKTQLDTHIGQSTEVHEELRRRMAAVERRPA